MFEEGVLWRMFIWDCSLEKLHLMLLKLSLFIGVFAIGYAFLWQEASVTMQYEYETEPGIPIESAYALGKCSSEPSMLLQLHPLMTAVTKQSSWDLGAGIERVVSIFSDSVPIFGSFKYSFSYDGEITLFNTSANSVMIMSAANAPMGVRVRTFHSIEFNDVTKQAKMKETVVITAPRSLLDFTAKKARDSHLELMQKKAILCSKNFEH
jgi:hypothetical protein